MSVMHIMSWTTAQAVFGRKTILYSSLLMTSKVDNRTEREAAVIARKTFQNLL